MPDGELFVVNCGHELCAPEHRYGPALRGYYLLHTVVSGRGVFQRGDRQWTVRAGQAFMIFPDDITIYTADAADPWEYVWIGFSGDGAAALAAQAGLSADRPVFSLGRFAPQITAITRAVYEDVTQLEQGGRAALGGLLRLCAYLGQIDRGQTGADAYKRAVWAINANYQRADFRITDAAAFAGLSRSQLFRVFRSLSGRSPHEELGRLRLNHARQLLSNTQLTLNEVALSSGYSSAARMGEIFRAKLGVTPTQYRRQARACGAAD